ncbi:MAG: acyl carrier protein [Flavobacteriaceae bacterium]|jgi:acyl carrier protein|nr:acyl carrier protein [Flavobacteriaceae bacterium]
MSKKLYNLISKVMSVEVFQINDESGPETIESWDSFHGLVLVDEIENNFQIKFTLEEIIDVKKVVDIKRHLKSHGVILYD